MLYCFLGIYIRELNELVAAGHNFEESFLGSSLVKLLRKSTTEWLVTYLRSTEINANKFEIPSSGTLI